jgi:hypothetical protein
MGSVTVIVCNAYIVVSRKYTNTGLMVEPLEQMATPLTNAQEDQLWVESKKKSSANGVPREITTLPARFKQQHRLLL